MSTKELLFLPFFFLEGRRIVQQVYLQTSWPTRISFSAANECHRLYNKLYFELGHNKDLAQGNDGVLH